MWNMFSHQDESSNPNTRVSSLPIGAFLYLGAEILIAVLISLLLAVLTLIKHVLPKPPRALTNDTVVITGARSGLGKAIAEEFLKAGCIVACIDKNFNSYQEISPELTSQYQRIDQLEPQNEFRQVSTQQKIFTYECDSISKPDILRVSKKIHKDIGHVDILITCTEDSSQDILDVVSTDLMNHYWTMLAFIPFMIKCKHSHVVTIIPTTSTKDAYMGSKAAIAGIIEAIAQQFSNSNQLIFTTVAPKAEPRLMKQSTRQTAQDIVDAVRRDRRTVTTSWVSYFFYPMCYIIHEAINSLTHWLYIRQSSDELI